MGTLSSVWCLPEVPDVHFADVEGIDHPLVLGVAVAVLVRTQSVSDTFVRVNNRAGKVVRRIHLPLVTVRQCSDGAYICSRRSGDSPSTVMRRQVHPVDDRVAEGLVGVVDAHFCTETPAGTLRRPLGHLLEVLQVVFDRVIAVLGGNTVHTFLPHLLLLGVICIRLSCLDHLQSKLVQLGEVIGCMRDSVAMDLKER